MVIILSATIISCTQSAAIIYRLLQVSNLTNQQKTEIVKEINKVIPSCPVIIDDRR